MTHIGMPPDLLNSLVVKVTRVAHEASDDVVCVLEAIEDVRRERELGALSQLHAVILALGVDALHPRVMLFGVVVLDVLLEHDNVRVGHRFRVY